MTYATQYKNLYQAGIVTISHIEKEAKIVDQNWDTEETTYTFFDGSQLVQSGPFLEVL